MSEDGAELGLYVDGRRVASPGSFAEAARLLRDTLNSFLWATLHLPGRERVEALADQLGLGRPVVDPTSVGHHRPKLERHPDATFLALRVGRYDDEQESVRFGEVQAIVADRVVVTVTRSGWPDLARLRSELEASPSELAAGPGVVLLRLVDLVVDGYLPIVYGINNDIDEIDAQVFTGHSEVSRRIYQLTREVIEFQRALRPVAALLAELRHEALFVTLGDRYRQELRNIEDHVASLNERIDAMREALVSVLNLHLALQQQTSNDQIRDMSRAALKQAQDSRRIAAWAGVIFVPSLITGVYGMNFRHMPELGWEFGYPFALLLMAGSALVMWLVFRWQKWL